ncbi:hypothetical protein GCM10027590_20780 [Nocardiopsis nanhaiensis]
MLLECVPYRAGAGFRAGVMVVPGFPVSCRLMVAVSAARLKVVAIERFARQWRSTLTRFAATAGGRLSGNGGRVVGEAMGPFGARRALRHKHGLAAVTGHSAGALTPGGVAAGHALLRTPRPGGRCLPLRRSGTVGGVAAGHGVWRTPVGEWGLVSGGGRCRGVGEAPCWRQKQG